jgi:hypothetical protein
LIGSYFRGNESTYKTQPSDNDDGDTLIQLT